MSPAHEPTDCSLPLPTGLAWQVADDCQHAATVPFERWLRSGQAHVVKSGEHRTVYRVDTPEQTLFVKHYRCHSRAGAGLSLLRGSTARREWTKAAELVRRNIPTVLPLALAEQHKRGMVFDNVLVTVGVDDACSLDEYHDVRLPVLSQSAQARVRRRLNAALAKLCARAHQAGVRHNDFHTGNILVSRATGIEEPSAAEPQLLLIDVPAVRLTGPLDWRASRANLVMLGCGWMHRSTRAERWRFWQAYLAERPELAISDARARVDELEQGILRYARRLFAGRDKRSLRTNRHFVRTSSRNGLVLALRELPADAVAEIAAAPGQWLARFAAAPVKLSHSSVVVRAELPFGLPAQAVAFKRAREASPWKRFAAWIRGSRARRAWQLGHALLERGISTPRPLLMIEPKRARGESYLATEWIDGALDLHSYLWQLAKRPAAEQTARLNALATSVGMLLGNLHRWHLTHRDLKGCNILAREHEAGLTTYLLDLDSVRRPRNLDEHVRAANLARLAVSAEAHPCVTHTLRLRFLRAYLRACGSPVPNWKQLWGSIAEAAQPIRSRPRRAGERVW